MTPGTVMNPRMIPNGAVINRNRDSIAVYR
jgi:hypothetical protein